MGWPSGGRRDPQGEHCVPRVNVKHTHSGGMDPQAKANASLSSLGDLGQVSWAVFTSWVSLGELKEMKYGKPSA